jgi:hypothetical protein
MSAWSAVLVCSNLNSASQDNEGLAQWHAVGLVRAGTHFYIYSSTFNPAEYLAASSSPPRLSSQSGCINAEYILNLMRTNQAKLYLPIKGAQGYPVKGRGIRVDKIWMTGNGSTALEDIPECTQVLII